MADDGHFHNLKRGGIPRQLAEGLSARVFPGEHLMLSVVDIAPVKKLKRPVTLKFFGWARERNADFTTSAGLAQLSCSSATSSSGQPV